MTLSRVKGDPRSYDTAWEPPAERIFKFLRSAGNSNNMAVDGSITPVEFSFAPNNASNARIERMIFAIRSSGAAGLNDFGDIPNGLSNGWSLKVLDSQDATVVDFFDGDLVKSNSDLSLLSYDAQNLGLGQPGNDIWTARLTFSRSGPPIDFRKGHNLRFCIEIQDDLSSLVSMRALVQGHYHD